MTNETEGQGAPDDDAPELDEAGIAANAPPPELATKTLDVTDIEGARAATPDIVTFGNGDTWRLLCKASSQSEGWMKSTKVLEITNLGVLVQVSTQQNGVVAEAVTFVPGARLKTLAEGGDRANPVLIAR